jgi:sulfhydrogenase subunit gamma (sulfur reductase)
MNTPAFQPLAIRDTHSESPELTHVTLAAPPEFLRAHTQPGQYVQVEVPSQKPGFFAIANEPGSDAIELLIKRGGPVADYVVARKTGETLSVSAPAGKGYPLDQARGKTLVLVGIGSAMAPLRSVLRTILKQRADFGEIHFYYGAREQSWVPYRAEVDALAKQNVVFHPAWSVFNADGTFTGERVQDALLREKLALAPDSAVFVCGMKPMVADVTAALGQLGVPPARVFQNF